MSSILDKVNEVYAEQNPSNYIRVNKKNLEKLRQLRLMLKLNLLTQKQPMKVQG